MDEPGVARLDRGIAPDPRQIVGDQRLAGGQCIGHAPDGVGQLRIDLGEGPRADAP